MLRTTFAAVLAAVLAIHALAAPAALPPAGREFVEAEPVELVELELEVDVAEGVPMFRICALRADIEAHLLADRQRKIVVWYEGRPLERILSAFKSGTSQQEIAGDGLLVATYPGVRDRLFLFQQGCFLAWGDRSPGWAARQAGG